MSSIPNTSTVRTHTNIQQQPTIASAQNNTPNIPLQSDHSNHSNYSTRSNYSNQSNQSNKINQDNRSNQSNQSTQVNRNNVEPVLSQHNESNRKSIYQSSQPNKLNEPISMQHNRHNVLSDSIPPQPIQPNKLPEVVSVPVPVPVSSQTITPIVKTEMIETKTIESQKIPQIQYNIANKTSHIHIISKENNPDPISSKISNTTCDFNLLSVDDNSCFVPQKFIPRSLESEVLVSKPKLMDESRSIYKSTDDSIDDSSKSLPSFNDQTTKTPYTNIQTYSISESSLPSFNDHTIKPYANGQTYAVSDSSSLPENIIESMNNFQPRPMIPQPNKISPYVPAITGSSKMSSSIDETFGVSIDASMTNPASLSSDFSSPTEKSIRNLRRQANTLDKLEVRRGRADNNRVDPF
jgi:hypothetical protein